MAAMKDIPMGRGSTSAIAAEASGYRRFDVPDAVAYAAACPPLDEAVASGASLTGREVGDGNLNQIFIVCSDTGVSAVLKQALPYVRLVGESWPLTTERNRFEREATALYGTFVPDLVPTIYHEDDRLALFIMEDLSRLRVVRRALIEMCPLPRLVSDVARFAAESLVRTSDFYVTSAEKKRLVARFINPQLCKITEDLVLTDPFRDAEGNSFEPPLRPAVEALWADEGTRNNLDLLRHAFMTRAEALLHGDLHTGSVMASRDETKVVDAEFCFFGPIGFDIGMFIANLFLSAVSHYAQATTPARRAYADALVMSARDTWATFGDRTVALLADAPVWRLSASARDDFMHGLLRDATGFAGAEMIRRTIGLARVAELEEIADLATRVRAKTAALDIGRRLISTSRGVDSFVQVLSIVGEITEEQLR